MLPGTGDNLLTTAGHGPNHPARATSVPVGRVGPVFKRVIVHARLDHPVEPVFRYLSDPMSWHEFAPAVEMRRQIGSGQPGIGTRWAATDRIGPFRLHFTDELVDHVPYRLVAWRSSAPWNALTEYVCSPDGLGTRVHASYEGDVDGWLRLLSWAPASVIGLFLARDFMRLHRRLQGRRT